MWEVAQLGALILCWSLAAKEQISYAAIQSRTYSRARNRFNHRSALDAAFGSKTSEDQQEIIAELQLHASGAGFAGACVPVWNAGGKEPLAFIAPENWHSFFRNITLARIVASINREIFGSYIFQGERLLNFRVPVHPSHAELLW